MRASRTLLAIGLLAVLVGATGADDEPLRIAVVDVNQALNSTDEGKAAREELARKQREAEARVQPRIERFKELQSSLEERFAEADEAAEDAEDAAEDAEGVVARDAACDERVVADADAGGGVLRGADAVDDGTGLVEGAVRGGANAVDSVFDGIGSLFDDEPAQERKP